MKNKEKIIIIGLAVLIAVLFGVYFFIPGKKRLSQPLKTSQNQTITVFQNLFETTKDKQAFTKIVLTQGKTALDLLKLTAGIKTQGNGAMAYVTEINGLMADTTKKDYWAFYVNDKLAEVGAGSYLLKNNDRILWKIEKY